MTTHAKERAVEVRGLRKRYGNVTAVDGVDLEIRAGEVRVLGEDRRRARARGVHLFLP